jgi:hypothetical protein
MSEEFENSTITISVKDFETKYVSRQAYDELKAELAAARAANLTLRQNMALLVPVKPQPRDSEPWEAK